MDKDTKELLKMFRFIAWTCVAGVLVLIAFFIHMSPADAKTRSRVSPLPANKPLKTINFGRSSCSGAFIAPRLIVTAAHCVLRYSIFNSILTVDDEITAYRIIYHSTKIGIINIDGVAVLRLLDTKYNGPLVSVSTKEFDKTALYGSACIARGKLYANAAFRVQPRANREMTLGVAFHKTDNGCSGAALVGVGGGLEGVLLYNNKYRGRRIAEYYLLSTEEKDAISEWAKERK